MANRQFYLYNNSYHSPNRITLFFNTKTYQGGIRQGKPESGRAAIRCSTGCCSACPAENSFCGCNFSHWKTLGINWLGINRNTDRIVHLCAPGRRSRSIGSQRARKMRGCCPWRGTTAHRPCRRRAEICTHPCSPTVNSVCSFEFPMKSNHLPWQARDKHT